MSSVRPGSPGATRECPHCRETILESAGVCPACRHYLRFDAGADAPPVPALTPLRIEGSIRHPADGEPWEYTVVVSIRNDRGEETARKLIGVGAMNSERAAHVHAVGRSRVGEGETSRSGRHTLLGPLADPRVRKSRAIGEPNFPFTASHARGQSRRRWRSSVVLPPSLRRGEPQ